MKKQKLRCAIYTRKSTEEGLDQAFNTLHAQREACEAYIQSQLHEGWQVIPTFYDDGGYSGGNMERPALKQLLKDIEDGKVDIVVVYKIDRLTRSLADFAKMVDIFDCEDHPVSFVSVTQQFNTTTSMGRLTLNVLLSFAQFEREVIGERVRDKIKASKKKGMWMGGLLPLGYDVNNKQLLVNEEEAKTVNLIFDTYLKLQSVNALKEELDSQRIVSKIHISKAGNKSGGNPFVRGALYTILKNPVYIGSIRHKDKVYEGNHEPIIDLTTWEKVQKLLSENGVEKPIRKTIQSQSLLTGLLYDENQNRLTPSHAVKTDSKGGKKRYRYYVTNNVNKSSKLRLPAIDLEQSIITKLTEFLEDHDALNTSLTQYITSAADYDQIEENRSHLTEQLASAPTNIKAHLLQQIIHAVTITQQEINIQLNMAKLADHLLGKVKDREEQLHDITFPFEFKRCGVEMKMILGNTDQDSGLNQPLIKALIKGKQLLDKLTSSNNLTLAELARSEEIAISYLNRLLQMPLLSPRIQDAILAGTQPADLTAQKIMYLGNLPNDWKKQEELLGF